MLAAKQLRPSFKNFLVGLVLAGAWGAALALGIHLLTKMGHHLRWKPAVEIGAIAASGLYLLHQPPVGKLWGKLHWYLALPFSLVYHVGAFPGLLVGRIAGLLDFAPHGASAAAGGKAAQKRLIQGLSQYTGRIVAEGEVAFLDMELTRGETVFEIHEDGRTSSEKVRFWGWVDENGGVHEGAGTADNAVDAKVIAQIKNDACFVGSKRIGYWEKTY
jgi:hypothetical protein